MTPLQWAIYNAIRRAGQHGISCERLMLVADNHRATRRLDRPKHAQKIIHVTVCQINRELGPVIRGAKGGDRLYSCIRQHLPIKQLGVFLRGQS